MHRWAAVSKIEFGASGEVRHLVEIGATSSLCGVMASHSEVWRGNSDKPNCTTCISDAHEEGILVPTGSPPKKGKR